MLDKILYVVGKCEMPVEIIATVCFITLHTKRYNDQLLPLLRYFLLIPNRIKMYGFQNELSHLLF
jgi:hypothetical protein